MIEFSRSRSRDLSTKVLEYPERTIPEQGLKMNIIIYFYFYLKLKPQARSRVGGFNSLTTFNFFFSLT